MTILDSRYQQKCEWSWLDNGPLTITSKKNYNYWTLTKSGKDGCLFTDIKSLKDGCVEITFQVDTDPYCALFFSNSTWLPAVL